MAARYARVSVSSLTSWLKQAREERDAIAAGNEPNPERKPFLALLSAIEDAEADAGMSWLQVVDKAAQSDPNWAWRMLKQRFPEGFQDVVQAQVSGPGGAPIEFIEVARPTEEASGE